MRSDLERLRDILEAIQKIEHYTGEGKIQFEANELIQTWTLYHLQIIGEATGRLSNQIRDQNPDIPWPQIISLRNIIVHHYFGIDLEEIWTTVQKDLPVFKNQVKQIMQQLD
jgi:uncharacterized protein with HEPN domain